MLVEILTETGTELTIHLKKNTINIKISTNNFSFLFLAGKSSSKGSYPYPLI